MKFSTNWIAEFIREYRGAISQQIEIHEVFTDSRKHVDRGLFIPIRGEKFDGHDFLKNAIENGAVASIWQKDYEVPTYLPSDFPLFFVEDTIESLQKLAMSYREMINPIVIGITGSNGKTTTKDFVANILSQKYKTKKTEGNFNNHIGLPLSILAMPNDTEALVLEMGMNHFGEIERLSTIAKPDVAIITNIGESHIEYLGSRAGIAQAKSEILAGLKENGIFIFDGDEELLQPLKERSDFNPISCGFGNANNVVIDQVQIKDTSTSFRLNGEESYEISVLGYHQAKNASYAIMVGKQFEVSFDKIKSALKEIKLTGMRFELMKGKNEVSIINDAYNASPTSMKASIEVFKQMNAKKKVAILGDMFELGESAKEFHRHVANAITKEIQVVFTIGSNAKEISEQVKNISSDIEVQHFHEKDSLVKALTPYLHKDYLLLFKASRGMKLETIINEIM